MHWARAESSPADRLVAGRPRLYALSLGAGFDSFVVENAIGHPQRVFPTFVLAGVMARESASWCVLVDQRWTGSTTG
jgi:hypothetical protein